MEKIKNDLIGRTITEPTRMLYRSKFEVKSIENVQDVAIQESKKTGDEIRYVIHAELNGEVNKYVADLNITYKLGNYDDWTIQYIENKMLDIVPTGKYNNCIKANLTESGWGIIQTVHFTNNCDVALLVEGVAFYNNDWHPFHALIKANDSRDASTGFADIKDFQIKRIEQP
ncbi:MAG: hypothetical protein LBV74_00040 [Tannerella sp.]|nr:hypothetical protein [Tannerella sp.]